MDGANIVTSDAIPVAPASCRGKPHLARWGFLVAGSERRGERLLGTGFHPTWLVLRTSKQPATLTLRQPSLGSWIEGDKPSLRAAGIVGIPHAIRLLF